MRIYPPEQTTINGFHGHRSWVDAPCKLTGEARADAVLSRFPVHVFLPRNRPAAETPIVLALQGTANPWHHSQFILPTLLSRGIAVVFVEQPFAGERGFAPDKPGEMLDQLARLPDPTFEIDDRLMERFMHIVSRDLRIALGIAREKHGLTSDKVALFGVSLGALSSSFAFMRDGIGQRLLCTIGIPDLYWFAQSFSGLTGRAAARVETLIPDFMLPDKFMPHRNLIRMLGALTYGGAPAIAANPMTWIDRVGPDRRVRILAGSADHLLDPQHAIACAERFPDGRAYIVPGMGHGGEEGGFTHHVGNFLATQLGDWSAR
jgi:pimeloyl-ACP methyl ester carboxylesterase